MIEEQRVVGSLEAEVDPLKRYPVIVIKLLEGKLKPTKFNLHRYIAAGRVWVDEISRRNTPHTGSLIPLLEYQRRKKDGIYLIQESPWGRPDEIEIHFTALEELLDTTGKIQRKSDKIGAAIAPFMEDLRYSRYLRAQLLASPVHLPVHATEGTRTYRECIQNRVPSHLQTRIESTNNVIQVIQNLAAPQK